MKKNCANYQAEIAYKKTAHFFFSHSYSSYFNAGFYRLSIGGKHA